MASFQLIHTLPSYGRFSHHSSPSRSPGWSPHKPPPPRHVRQPAIAHGLPLLAGHAGTVVAAGEPTAPQPQPHHPEQPPDVVSIPIRSQRVLLAIGRLVVEARQVREAIGEFLRHLIAR